VWASEKVQTKTTADQSGPAILRAATFDGEATVTVTGTPFLRE